MSSDAENLLGPHTKIACNIVYPHPLTHGANVYLARYTISRSERACQAGKSKQVKNRQAGDNWGLLLRPPNGRKYAAAFFNHQKLIGGDAFQLLLQATGPANLEISRSFGSKAKVQPWVIGRIKA